MFICIDSCSLLNRQINARGVSPDQYLTNSQCKMNREISKMKTFSDRDKSDLFAPTEKTNVIFYLLSIWYKPLTARFLHNVSFYLHFPLGNTFQPVYWIIINQIHYSIFHWDWSCAQKTILIHSLDFPGQISLLLSEEVAALSIIISISLYFTWTLF